MKIVVIVSIIALGLSSAVRAEKTRSVAPNAAEHMSSDIVREQQELRNLAFGFKESVDREKAYKLCFKNLAGSDSPTTQQTLWCRNLVFGRALNQQ